MNSLSSQGLVATGYVPHQEVTQVETMERAEMRRHEAARRQKTKAIQWCHSSMVSVMLPFWLEASSQLGFVLGQNKSRVCSFLAQFYNTYFQVQKWQIANTTFSYIRLWKCANNAIFCNLQRLAHDPTVVGSDNDVSSLSFSFVRDPLSRFVSAYAEINFQLYRQHGCTRQSASFLEYPLNSHARAKAFIKDVLNGNMNPECWISRNVFSLLGQLRQYAKLHAPIDFVGRLESFERDWDRLQSVSGVYFSSWDSGCGLHAATNDTSIHSDRKAMSEVIHTQGNFLLALHCAVLLPDYECLGYIGAIDKHKCVEAGYAASLREWDAAVDRMRSLLCPDIVTLAPLKDMI